MKRTKTDKLHLAILATGLSSDVATKAVDKGFTVSKLRKATSAELRQHFAAEDVLFIRERLQRKKIRADVVFRLLDESNGKCCVCWKFSTESPIVFHHIEEHSVSADDRYENLAVLCLNHHALAHTRSGMSRHSLPPEIIRERKSAWIEAVAAHRSGKRDAPGDERARPHVPQPRPPAVATKIVGRSGPREEIKAALLGKSGRAAISGMGGVGKSVLSLQLANDLLPFFTGGVLWASLGEYSGDPKALMKHWARTCGSDLPESLSEVDLASTLRNCLSEYSERRGRLLVVIDDARIEWIEEVKVVAQSIPAEAALLITTREQAVATATNCELIELEVIDTESAFTLLDMHAGYEVRHVAPEAAAEVIGLLGNLPLAIELLGKHIAGVRRKPTFTLEGLVSELRKERLNRLKLPGHPALTAVFALSYRGLGDREKRAFRYLGVFSSTVVSAVHLAGIVDARPDELEHTLDHLVGSSLLSWTELANTYRVHPLLREYSIKLLSRKKAEADRACHAHFAYFAAFALDRGQQGDPSAWEKYLPEIVHGVRAAGLQNHQLVLDLANYLWTESSLLSIRGHYREGMVLLEAATMGAKKLGRRDLMAAHIGNLGVTHAVLGEPGKAKKCYQRAISIAETLGDQYDIPAFLGNLGLLLEREGDWKSAYECFEKALSLGTQLGNHDVVLNQLSSLGSLFRHRDPARARHYYQLGISLAHKHRDVGFRANVTSNLGLIHFDAGEFSDAEECISLSLEIAKRIGDRAGEANRLGHLGNIAVARGDNSAAICLFREAVSINREIGYVARESDWLGNLGLALWRSGDRASAFQAVRDALQLSITSAHAEAEGINHLRLATMLYESGDTSSGADHMAAARTILGDVTIPAGFTA
jgi:tetratricopeptide (TPR) repeat protein